MLARLLDEVAAEKLENTREALLKRAQRLWRSGFARHTMKQKNEQVDPEVTNGKSDGLSGLARRPARSMISPFNEVDGLILAELSFVDFDGIVPPPELGRGRAALRGGGRRYFARHGGQEIDMGVLVPDTHPQTLRRRMAQLRALRR